LFLTGANATMHINTSMDRITRAFIDQGVLDIEDAEFAPSNRPAAH
jgi:hypothetical protein